MSNDEKKESVEQTKIATAKKKKKTLFNFYENVISGTELFSHEELDVAIESMKLAQLDIRERERKKIQIKEAEDLKKKMAAKEKRRNAAIEREKQRREAKHKAHVDNVTAMDLPTDFENAFKNDERANVHCESVADALLISIDTLGLVDIEFIASITGVDEKTVIERLKGSIFQNPLHWDECWYKGWETADEYLSGNLQHKLQLAKEANEEYLGYFDANVKALEQLITPLIAVKDIYITLGSPWVPTDIIDDFILHLVGLDRGKNGEYPPSASPFLDPKYAVIHDDATGLWDIPFKTRFRTAHNHGKYEEQNYHIWGTERMDMLYLMEHILNMRTLAIFDYVGAGEKKTKLLNSNETVKILEKQDKMVEEFQSWVWKDKTRKKRLQGAYNRRYGNLRKRHFDGSFFEFPGMNPEIQLHPHQKNSVARIIFSENTLLAHDVGAGKTFTMIAAGMELRRLGKSQKNMYVIPNNIIAQWRRMFLKMYPDANILLVDRRNFNVKKRAHTLNRIMNEDFDAILITYSCFDMLSLSKKYYIDLYEKRLKMLTEAKEKFSSAISIEAKRQAAHNTLLKLQESMTEEICEVPFDELGINTLFVDEAHNYKNVSLNSGIQRVRGISSTGSKKCDAMMDKVHCVQRQNHGGRVIMATGTPITNSITDLFILQKYLQDGELEFMGVQNFDSWVAMFGKKVSEFEIDVDTNSYRLATRFAKFCNIPELTAILSSISDFYHVDNSMGLPEFGGYEDSVAPGNEDFKLFLKDISNRADDVRKKRVHPKDDNLLKITTDGRKAALDMRLIDMAYGLDLTSKVVRCAENIFDIYENTREDKRIQMVFCDTSTPKPTFNLYDELKNILMAMGIPEHQIAFIHSADSEDKKNLLFHDLRNGDIAVIIGSTFKMGLGVNVQERLCALHHLDVPWRPADMVQREGRILRQGNLCESVKIYRYITKGSFDAYSWQLLEKKQRFISQILSGEVFVREGDDVDEAVLNYAEVKALSVGNPLIKQKVEISNELDRLRILQKGFLISRDNMEQELTGLPEKIERQKLRIAEVEQDILHYETNKVDYKSMDTEEQRAIRDSVYAAVKENVNRPVETKVLTYQGFEVVVPARMIPRMPNLRNLPEDQAKTVKRDPVPYVCVKKNGTYTMEVETHLGITKRLNNLLENLTGEKDRREAVLEALLKKQETLRNELKGAVNSYADEIFRLSEELNDINEKLGVA